MDFEKLLQDAEALALPILKSVVVAVLVWIIGTFIIRLIRKGIQRFLRKKDWDKSVESFLISLLSALLYITLLIAVVSILGVPTSSFLAILGSVGLAIGLALQGSLANIAGGVLLLILKPLKVDDFVEVEGKMGTVVSLNLFYTIVATLDNQQLHIPNGKLANGNILNFSQRDTRRVSVQVGIAYEADIDQARKVLMDLMEKDERILKDPAPKVVVMNLGDSSVDLTLWAWVKREDFGDVLFGLRESAKTSLDAANISIPYPQREVRMIQN